MKLVIAEKSALAKQIADAIDGEKRQLNNLTVAKGDYIITYLGGHAMTHVKPEDIDPKYRKWTLEDLPIYFDNWGKTISDDKKSIAGNVKRLLAEKNVDAVINAGDMDDEGQLLVDEMLDWCKNTKPVYRLSTADTTKEALHNSLVSLKPNDGFLAQGYAAEARSLADMVFGFNYTRLFSLKSGRTLNVGRVQTPTLKLVVDRDAEIEHFVPKNYTELYFKANGYDSVKVHLPDDDEMLDRDGYLSDKDNVEKIKAMYSGGTFGGEVLSKKRREAPPKPFNLATLGKELEKRFGYTPADTMAITQSLRDKYNAISYNRSESEYLPEEYFNNRKKMIGKVLQNVGGMEGFAENEGYRSRCFDDSKITLHFAIIPQNVSVDISKMTEKERNCYITIVKRYLLQFMGDRLYDEKTLEIDLGNGRTAKAVSTCTTEKGWTALQKAGDDEDERQSEKKNDPILFADGKDSFILTEPAMKECVTKPPKRYTPATLVFDMCRVSKFVKDPRVKELLLKKDEGKTGDRGSIGTSATRDKIVENLIKRGYLKKDRKNIISTELGRSFVKTLPPPLSSIDTTALWFEMQEDIKEGRKGIAELPKSVLAQFEMIRGRIGSIDIKDISHETKNANRAKSDGGIRETENAWYTKASDGTLCVLSKNCKFFEAKKFSPSAKDVACVFSKGRIENAELYSEKTGRTYRADINIEWREKDSEKGKIRFAIPKVDASGFEKQGKTDMSENGVLTDLPNMWKMTKDGDNFILMKTNRFVQSSRLVLTNEDVDRLFHGETMEGVQLYSEKKRKKYKADISLEFKKADNGNTYFASFVFGNGKNLSDKEV